MSVAPTRVRPVTMAGLLRARAAESPNREAYLFLTEGEAEGERLTWGELDRRARVVASALRSGLRQGDRALLLYPPGLDFVAAFFGCLYARAVAVPAYPPRPHDRSPDRLRAIARDAEPRAVLTTESILAYAAKDCGEALAAARWIATDGLSVAAGGSGGFGRGEAEPDDPEDLEAVAFLQYTSGSTAAPKGVMVTHGNLLHNEAAIGAAFRQDEDSVVVGWLPLYHDMGLIGNVLQPLHAGSRCVLMSPAAFLQRPRRWLEAVTRYHATTSGGPSFAYELCVRRIPAEQREGLDLRSWRVAFNGAEPVRAETMERFAAAFEPCGFDPAAFYPCYGLAEATLFVSGAAAGRLPRREAVTGARPLVSCGHAWGGQRIVIANPETGAELPAGREGEIWVAGPSVAAGYWRNPEATQRDFQARLAGGEGPFLRTGDLGVLQGGELFVTGRIKDLVILRGRNHYPQDLERTAEAAHPDLRPSGCAAFAVEESGEERLVLVAEVERRRRDDLAAIAEEVRRAIAEEHEVQAGEVALVRPGGVPKTSSGKVRRSACRASWQAGELPVLARSTVGATATEDAQAAKEMDLAELSAVPEADRRAVVEHFLRFHAAAVLCIAAEAIDPARPLTSYGLDSLGAMELKGRVEEALRVTLPLGELLAGAGTGRLAENLTPRPPLPSPPRPPGEGETRERERGTDHLAAAFPPLPGEGGAMGEGGQGGEVLSFGERALWFLDRLAPEQAAYNIAVAGRVTGDLDTAALRRAFAALIDRHEGLRTVFPLVGDSPVRLVLPTGTAGVDFREIGGEDASGWSEESLSEWLAEEAWRPFDLSTGTLMRLRIVRGTAEERVLLLAVHHLVADFWSLAVIARELGGLLRAEPMGASRQLASPAGFARWQAEMLGSPRGEELWESWRQALAGLPDLGLPIDRPRPPVQTWRGLARTAVLPAETAAVVRALASGHGATLFMALLAAWQAQLGRSTGQDDFAVGTPIAGRGAPEWAGAVGYLVNPVALRADLGGDPPVAELIARVRRTMLAALADADFPFALLAERLRPSRDPARPPIFQTLFILQRQRPGDPPGLAAFSVGAGGDPGVLFQWAGLKLAPVAVPAPRALCELTLTAADLPGGGLALSLNANADLFEAATVERMLGHFRALLGGLADPERRLSELPLLAAAERWQLLGEWNEEGLAEAPSFCLHELIAAQVARTPDASAVFSGLSGLSGLSGVESLSYGELDARSNRLARRLLRLGVRPGTAVAVALERSLEMVVALLAVAKAGGAYVPLDLSHPAERRAFILEDSGASVLLTQAGAVPAAAEGLTVMELVSGAAEEAGERDGPLPPISGPEDLVYILYTSGSTGRPKGVEVRHGGLVSLLGGLLREPGLTAGDAVLAVTTLSFDIAAVELFLPLAVGARVILADRETARDGARLAAALPEVTVLQATPATWRLLLAAEWEGKSGLKALCGGEALSVALASEIAARSGALWNLYGPTETTVYSAWQRFDTDSGCFGPSGTVPIGRPVAGTVLHVLGHRLEPVPAGAIGELCIGGQGLARGYRRRPRLTAESFVPDPFAAVPGARLYRTGDLGRRLHDGAIELLGRADQQVKVRGYRIEPGEIEARLAEHPAVRAAAVLALDREGDRRLTAFVALASETTAAELRRFLGERLPDFMVPTAWAILPALPINPHGKVDRKALAGFASLASLATVEEPTAGSPGIAPRSQQEGLLADLFAELLGRERVRSHEDFFALGGHSLLATKAVARISRLFGVDLPVAAVFQAPTVAGLAARIAAAAGVEAPPPIHPVLRPHEEKTEGLPLSFAQQRLWFLDRLQPGGTAYNMPGAFRLSGPLAVAALAAALGEAVRRHESLRTRFVELAGRPVQIVDPSAPVPLPVIDLAALPPAVRETAAGRLAAEEAARPFDLAAGPLLRAALLRLAPQEHVELVTVHHIVSDGWSLGVLVGELAALYGAFVDHRPSSLPEPPVQYADYAVWQRERSNGGAMAAQLAWWKDRLAGAPTTLELPADRPRPAMRNERGVRFQAPLLPELAAGLRRLSRQRGITLYMALLAGFEALLARITGQADFLLGSVVSNRTRPETEGVIGLFANTLVLRARLDDDPPAAQIFARCRETALGAWAHQDLPLETLVEELQPEREPGWTPLFQVLFVVQNAPLVVELPGLSLRRLAVDEVSAKLDLALEITEEADGGLTSGWELARDLFSAASARRFSGWLVNLLRGMAADPERRLSELPLLAAAERWQLLGEWNDGGLERGPELPCLHDLIAAQAARTPDAPAIVMAGHGMTSKTLTYAELEARSNRLARRLLRLGAGPGSAVAVAMERSPAVLVALLAVMKAGGAYVPLDPDHPAERLAYVMADSGAALLLTEPGVCLGVPDGLRVLALAPGEANEEESSDPLPPLAGPDDLVYILYTSGSTGRPKGCEVRHAGMVSFLLAMLREPGLTADDAVLAPTTISFDISGLELFLPLLAGAHSVLVDRETAMDGRRLAAALEMATVLQVTPATWRLLLAAGWQGRPGLKAMCGGEALPLALAREIAARTGSLWNVYGPTETTVWSAVHRFDPGEGAPGTSGNVPIGHPIDGMVYHLLGRRLEPVPAGVVGEIYIGGRGMGRGYRGRSALTAERFLPDPFAAVPGERLYRSGDLARRLPGGAIEFLGRVDHQVKVRGFRVELAEIEAVLAGHPGVREAAVIALDEAGGGKRLAAFVVAEPPGAAEPAVLRAYLGNRLPDYMIPGSWAVLDVLPVGPTGKVDRRALAHLPLPSVEGAGTALPRTPIEELVAGLFAELLGRDQAGPEDGFFDLGGHSLLATRLLSRIRSALGVDLPVSAVFQAPTVAGLAGRVAAALGSDRAATAALPIRPVPRGRGEGLPLSFAQRRLWFLDQLQPGGTAYNMPAAVRLTGPLAVSALATALGTVAQRHESLRTRFADHGGRPVQIVDPPAPVPLPVIDLTALPAAVRESAAKTLAAAEAGRPFDLAAGPLLRAALLRLAADEHVELLTIHHIVSDGWSLGVLAGEAAALYSSFVTGRPSHLPELPVQYADYSVWQQEGLAGGALAAQLAWWKGQLAGAPATLALPADRPRPALRTDRGFRIHARVPQELAAGLRGLARGNDATLFMTLLAGFAALLVRVTGQPDFLLGSVVANRTRPETEGLIGLFANMLVLRARLGDDPPFTAALERAREISLGAWAHQDLPLEALVEELQPEREQGRMPLLQAALLLQNAPVAVEIPGLAVLRLPVENAGAKLDLSLDLTAEADGSLTAEWELSRDLFVPITGARFAGWFENLLRGAVDDPERRLSDLPLLAAAERWQLLEEWNEEGLAEAPVLFLHELIAAQAARTPDALAVSSGLAGGEALSYGGLDARSNRLARRLRRLGVGPGTAVAVAVERSPEMVVTLLAVMKAGGAYVPLDPSHPAERLAFIQKDSGASVLLTQAEVLPAAAESDEPLPSLVGPDDLVYILYTSGSTGRPKGVEVRHGGLASLFDSLLREPGLTAEDAVLAVTTISFDIAAVELFLPLTVGARVVLVDGDTARDGQRLAEALKEATVLQATPATWRLLLAVGWEGKPGLKAMCGGEALPMGLAQEIAARTAALWNLYGPTETTIYSAWHRFDPAVVSRGTSGTVPIGRPVTGTVLHLLGPWLEPVPAGVVGELFIGGQGLARGYRNRPDLTGETFVPHPFAAAPGARLYRTGDLARRLPDGSLEFLGRADAQVKVRGVRIEPGEIEAALARHPAVLEAAVTVLGAPSEARRLTACVVFREEVPVPSFAELRAFLAGTLPGPMVPTAWARLDALPLTPSGKLDRRALAQVAPEESREGFEPPRSPIEEKLAGVWREVLGVERIGIHDRFFDLGGHSLLAVRAAFRIGEALGVQVPVSVLLQADTVAALAERLAKEPPFRPTALRAAIGPAESSGPWPQSPSQRRLWLTWRLQPASPVYNVPVAVRLRGAALDVGRLAASLAAVLRRHEPLRTVYSQSAGEPVQIVLPPPAEAPLAVIDLTGLSGAREAAFAVAAGAAGEQPFDLERGPVARFVLLRLGAAEHVLLATFHHIAVDGWSLEIFFSDLAAFYCGSPLPELPIRYLDFSSWQQRALAAGELDAQLDDWRRELAGLPVLELPADRPRSMGPVDRGASRPLALAPALEEALRALGRVDGASLFDVLLAGFAALLIRLSGQDDFGLGVPSAGRSQRETENLIGFFVSTLVLRVRSSDDPPFGELLRRLQAVSREAQSRQDVPFDRIVEELRPERALDQAPFFQVMFSFFTTRRTEAALPGLEMSLVDLERTTSPFDLSLGLHEDGSGVRGVLEYRTALFDAATIDRMAGHLLGLLAAAADAPALRLSDLPLLTPAESWQVLGEWTGGPSASPVHTLHGLIAESADRAPDALAILGEDGTALTRKELAGRAEQIAAWLRRMGIRPELRVALCVERSPWLAAGFLGILQAGGVCVPVDPEHGAARLAYVLEDAGAAAVIASPGSEVPSGVPVLWLDGAPLPAWAGGEAGEGSGVRALNLAYVIYTSGSTGRPKGVAVSHAAAVRHCLDWAAACEMGEADRVLQFASAGFDASVEQIFSALLSGAALVMRGPVPWSTRQLSQRIAELGLTIVDLPTAYWNRWVHDCADLAGDFSTLGRLRLVVVGGEELRAESARLWSRTPLAAVPLLNGYGPTEAVISATLHRVRIGESGEEEARPVPIGRPLAGRTARVLDRHGLPQPIGVPGELCLGGPLARGYLGDPALTAERFVPDPYVAMGGVRGERLYRSGDSARLRPDGALEFLGRIDRQVKVRGFRVEPGEIEAALARHPGVREAAVLVLEGPEGPEGRRLAACVVPANGAGEEELTGALRSFLRERLPGVMVPAAWAVLPALPLTVQGKVDRRELELLIAAAPVGSISKEDAAPRSPAEELLAGLFADLLGIERVGIEEDFFERGGDSLLATRLVARVWTAFGVELPLASVFEAPTPAALAALVEAALREGTPGPALPPLTREGAREAPLSFSQQRLWFLHQLEPESAAYHVPGAVRLRGRLRPEALERALAEIGRRHEALRTVFPATNDGPVQAVLPPDDRLLPVVDLSALPAAVRRTEADRALAGEAVRPFDLAAGPLVRAALLRLDPAEHLLSVVMHHIVSDAWSLGIMLGELSVLYQAFAGGEPSPLPEPQVQFADWARWQRLWMSGETLDRQLEHWRQALAGSPELDLSVDRPRPAIPSGRGGRRPFILEPAELAAIRGLSRRVGLTLFMTLLAALQALLARISGQEDVTVGSPIANRGRPEVEDLIGFFTNTLVLRLDLAGDPPFAELARRARAAALAAYAHQDLPFERLVEEIAPERQPGRNPLFQTMLVVEAAPPALSLPEVDAEPVVVDPGIAKFDLTLMLAEGDAGLTGYLEHSRDLFDAATVDRLLGHFRTLLAGAAADSGRRLSDLPLLTAAERAELAAWTQPLEPRPAPRLVHELVAIQAERHPEADAVIDGDTGERLSFAGLLGQARRLARRLEPLGVGPDVPVGILMERSPEMMVAILGVLEAGGAYLPLDPSYPRERLRMMLEDARAPVVLASGSLSGLVPEGAAHILMVEPEEAGDSELPLVSGVVPDNLAYLTYTSGSTGRPKGVAMTHAAISAMLGWQLRTSAAGGGRTLQFTSLTFDVSFQEIFSAWASGGAVVLVSEDVRRDPPALLALLARERVERLFLPFVALQQVAAATASGPLPASLREVMSAGEQLYVTPQVADLFSRLPGAELHNHYGPSETHAVTWLALRGDPETWPGRPAIGVPVDHARVFLLDRWLQPVPLGVAGEVWVGGAGLARGYQARPDLTAERFLPDPFADVNGWRPGDRLYRTGDLARRLPAGTLEFLGRADSQVKVRGQRIEPEEVETALVRHPAVLQAAVAVRGGSSGERRLTAYAVFREGVEAPGFPELRAFLAETLPDPMIPTAWARLPALPLTPSGKLDRRALARIAPEESRRDVEPPRTPVEETLAGIWREVLGMEKVDVHDDFFALGGHSLLATQVTSRIREAFRIELPLRRLFAAPTVAGLAREVEAARAEAGLAAAGAILRASRKGDLPLSFAQERLWLLDRLQPGGTAYAIPLALRATGPLSVPALAAAFAGVMRRHEALRTVFAERDGAPVQVVLAEVVQSLDVADLSALPAAVRQAEAVRLATADAARPFDLPRGPLLRTTLVVLGRPLPRPLPRAFPLAPTPSGRGEPPPNARDAFRDDGWWRPLSLGEKGRGHERGRVGEGAAGREHLLLINMHHIVSDGWSMSVLVREVGALYGAALRGGPPPLPELPIQYADFAVWQRAWLTGGVLERQLGAWRERLDGMPVALELPTDHPRPPVRSQRGLDHRFTLDAALSRRIAAVAQAEGATPFMGLAAGLFVLLARVTGQRDLALGSPVANRNRIEIEGLIGFFVNTLVLRADLSRAETCRDLLRQVREVSLDAYAHQDLPFEKLVDALQPDRDLSRSPLFQVALALQNAPLSATSLDGIALAVEEMPDRVAKFDLSFVFAEVDGRFEATLQAAADLFDATTLARLSGHLGTLLEALTRRPEAPWLDLPFLSAAERHQALAEWNDTREAAPRDALLHQLFESRADEQPEALAVVWDGSSWTYGELERRANQLARLLRRLGIEPGDAVGLWMERSLDMLAGVLAVLKAGGTYVPLDAGWPAERAESILAAGGARAALTRAAHLPALLDIRWRLPSLSDVVCLDAETPKPPTEPLDAESVRALWDYVAESAVDRATAGGFVSSFTGKPFSEAEVDEYRDRVLALAAPWLRPDARVLEIGCGAGLILWPIAGRVARCVGLDPSPRTQEHNREHALEAGIANVDLPIGFAHEAAELLAGESFDLVVMASAVQFFPGPLYLERVMEQSLGLLAPGGALLIADVPDARRQAELRRALAEAGAPGRPGHELWLDEELFADLAVEADVHHRTEGFANELRYRFDVIIPGGEASPVARRKRLWTAWHAAQESADRLPASAVPEGIAYVIHTSGSTGAPKGIAVQHAPAVDLVRWVGRRFGVGPADRLLFITSLAFDLSVWDIFGTLAAGATVHIASEAELRDPPRLARLLADGPVTIWDSAPAALQQLVPYFTEGGDAGRGLLRLVLLSGDWIPVPLPDRVRAAFPAAQVVSLGGATEATVWSNWHPVAAVDPRRPSIPYGRPIANARYHVLDEILEPCPIGVAGDLLIGGGCLCVGYSRQPALTADRFVPAPFAAEPGARLYRTGDRARHGADGVLELLGRRDQQVKVRGYRIELGEIETALARHPAVREAVAAVREDVPGDLRLVGYVVPAHQPGPALPELRSFLQETLPEYMVPWTFVILDAMPVTVNGKLDRAALPAPRPQSSRAAAAPRNDLERSIAAAWREVLGVDSVGVEESFFELGGSSLLLGRLHSRLRQSLGRDISFVDLFRYPTVESLARRLAAPVAGTPPEAHGAQARPRTEGRREALRTMQARRVVARRQQ